jgi:hypothetical protein
MDESHEKYLNDNIKKQIATGVIFIYRLENYQVNKYLFNLLIHKNIKFLKIEIFDLNSLIYLSKIINDIYIENLELKFSIYDFLGIKYLLNSLERNTHIKKLKLSFTETNYDSFIKFIVKKLINNKYITELDLSYNEIGDLGVERITELIKINKNIKKIFLCYISYENINIEPIINNTNILEFNISSKYYDNNENTEIQNKINKRLEKNKLIHARQIKNFAIYQYLFLNRIPRYIMKMISN